MTKELLCCPFCGGDSEIGHIERLGDDEWWAECTNKECPIRAYTKEPYATEAEAIEAWNTRSITAAERTCCFIPDDIGFSWYDDNDVEHFEEESASLECGSASCDKCGFSMLAGDEGWFEGWDEVSEWTEEGSDELHKGFLLIPKFSYCPNCGAKVVD